MNDVYFKTVSQISLDTNENIHSKTNQHKDESEGHESLQALPVRLTETPDPYRERYECQRETDTGRFQRQHHASDRKQQPHG
ncbi:hypothetical protein [Aeromonas intestinalis]